MIYKEFQDKRLSLLGFGAMRLPQMGDGTIDEEQVKEMVAYAMEHGVNYFDTAWPYHNGDSERIIGKVLGEYDRNRYYLATKYPGHQVSEAYHPAEIFEAQLQKCGVDYFDFYLLHNVYERSIDVYLDPKWGILEYFKEQKRLGRIKHLGFSTHAHIDGLKRFLDICGEEMEFCQIQMNYLDWTLQEAKEKYELLTQRGIPVWVMEPVRGGKLAKLSKEAESKLKDLCPQESIAAWGFRFLQQFPNVKMVLSGMSNLEQMKDNVKTFETRKQLSELEMNTLFEIAEQMKNTIPCTSCRYCCQGCPMELDIPKLIALYNDICFAPSIMAGLQVEALPEEKQPSACIGCGACAQICPQNIDIPKVMERFVEACEKIPSWAEVCREREAQQKK